MVLKGEAFEVNLTRNVKGTPKVYMPLQPTSACIIDLGKSRSQDFYSGSCQAFQQIKWLIDTGTVRLRLEILQVKLNLDLELEILQ